MGRTRGWKFEYVERAHVCVCLGLTVDVDLRYLCGYF